MRAEVHNDARVSDDSVLRNLLDFIVRHDEYRVGAFAFGFVVALRHAAKFFAESCFPYLLGDWVFDELLVLGDCLAGGWMDDGCAEVFDVHIEVTGAEFRWR